MGDGLQQPGSDDVSPRSRGDVRCALCHERLSPADARRCDGCGTLLHAECSLDLARCPTLGCPEASRAGVAPAAPPPARTRLRLGAWTFFGLIVPMIAFGVDLVLQKNPLAWGYLSLFPEPGAGVPLTPRATLVTLLAGVSMIGLVLALLGRSTRATVGLLALGVAFATAHALVFVPLLPLSLIGVLLIVGLLGLSPFAALWVYVDALRWSLREREAASPKDAAPSRWRRARLPAAIAAGALAAGLHWALPVTPRLPAPAALHLEGVDVDRLRAAARSILDAPVAGDGALPEPLRTVAAGGHMATGDGFVSVTWRHESPGMKAREFPYGYSLFVLTDEQALPPAPGTCFRSVEVAPGVWSQYLIKGEPPGEAPAFVRLPRD